MGGGPWFQRESTDPRTSSPIHDGVGSIEVRRLFRDRLTLPIHAQVWELPPSATEGDHTHAGTNHADNYEELYFVLSGTGTMTVEGVEHALEPGDSALVPVDIDHGLQAGPNEPLRILLIFGKTPAG